jgi:hypothetical protein
MASHLTLEEREIVAHPHRAGKVQTQIAGRSRSDLPRDRRRQIWHQTIYWFAKRRLTGFVPRPRRAWCPCQPCREQARLTQPWRREAP